MIYSKRRTNLGRRSKKSFNRKLKCLRGGSIPSILHCVDLLKTRFPFENKRADIRKRLDDDKCGLKDLKSHFNSVRLYTFGFSIRDLLDAGFSIYKLLNDGLDAEIYTEFNSMDDDDKHKVVEMNTYIETKIKEDSQPKDGQPNIVYTKNAIPKYKRKLTYKASFLEDKV